MNNVKVDRPTRKILGFVGALLLGISTPFIVMALPAAVAEIQDVVNTVTSPHSISDAIAVLPAENRANTKAQALANIGRIAKTRVGDYNIAIEQMNTIAGGVEVFARAWDSHGNQIGFGQDGSVDIERFRIFNPPILVDDPKGNIIRKWTDPETGKIHERRLREDVREALLRSIVHAMVVKKEKFDAINIEQGKIGNTTDIYYSDSGIGGTTVDGWMETLYSIGNGPAWSTHTARTAADYVSNDTDIYLSQLIVSDLTGGDHWRQLSRAFLGFNTTPLGTDTITAASLSVYGVQKGNGIGISPAPSFDVYTSTPLSNNVLVAEDFDQVGSVPQTTGSISLDSWNISGYNTWTFNATGIGNINRAGVSNFSLRNNYDVSNIAPNDNGWASTYADGYTVDQAGSANDPMLVVEHVASVFAAPTGLEVTPMFTALYDSAGSPLTATHYRLQISPYNSETGWTNPFWDSGKQPLSSPVPPGQRSPMVSASTTLNTGQTYYWRIRFWNQANQVGKWSTTTPIFMIGS